MELTDMHHPGLLKQLEPDGLERLAQQIRDFLIRQLAETGGHLGSNLGAVELSIALHYAFDSPDDQLVWDVGHQTYTHKLLTGRARHFPGLRKHRGLSGYLRRSENAHDIWEAGHSSTSVSAALGLTAARDIKGGRQHIAAVIGDGALTGGMVFEALNHLGDLQKHMVIVLNDNGMSISPNVGALQHVLDEAKEAGRTDSASGFFHALGIQYQGPVDGHSIPALVAAFELAKTAKGPVLVHVQTEKGKGYLPAERDAASHLHGVEPFDIETGPVKNEHKNEKSWSELVGSTLCRLAEENPDVAVLTPAMILGSRLETFAERFPERLFDTGIAEQHTVTMAAGMAVNGIKPVVSIYSTFLQRGYDQVLHDVCRQNLNVVFMIDRSGFVGADGDTHHGLFDLSFLRALPNLMIMMPYSLEECEAMVQLALECDSPVALRYPRGKAKSESELIDELPEFKRAPLIPGVWQTLAEGNDLAILAFGPLVETALAARARLLKQGISAQVVNARFIKPLDTVMLDDLLRRQMPLLTVEEGMLAGGFGSAVLEFIEESGMPFPKIKRLGVKDRFIQQGGIDELREETGLAALDIVAAAQHIID